MTKKISITVIAVMLLLTTSIIKAQTYAMPLSGNDCNGNPHDLIADLDAGKAVLLHFFMPNCPSCPPPAKKIQAMAYNIMATRPGMITAYAMPDNNSTTCSTVSKWCASNGLSLYMPYDSGFVQGTHYGGFGMPTVVLLGGSNHRVMFSTKSFRTSDTTIMRDSILALLNGTTDIADLPSAVSTFNVYPNPANDVVSINLELKEYSNLLIDVTDITGKQVAIISDEQQSTGIVTKQFNTAVFPNGNYFVRISVNGQTATQKLAVAH